jgi:hypothetical protein
MTEPVAARMQVVRKQDKEPKLKDFIRDALTALADRRLGHAPSCLVVARSQSSPILRALACFNDELHTRTFCVRIILSAAEIDDAADRTGAAIVDGTARIARNARLIDAHEFLVLGPRASWIGDSMRRDPSKRDAFEGFRADDADAVALAVRSFERLWALSEATPRRIGQTASLAAREAKPEPEAKAIAGDVPAAAAQDAAQAPVPGATRH